MSESSAFESGVVTRPPSATVVDLATVMSHSAIGCVIIVDEEQRPVGVVTDRDLCLRVVARGLDPQKACAQDVMSTPVYTARSDEHLKAVVAHMRERRIRRVPVVQDDRLVGIITMDDVLVWLSHQLDDLGRGMEEVISTARSRRHPLGRLFGH
jgi:CBS domain-containing protein